MKKLVLDDFPDSVYYSQVYESTAGSLGIELIKEAVKEANREFFARNCGNCRFLITNEITRCKLDVVQDIHKHLVSRYDTSFMCNKWEDKDD